MDPIAGLIYNDSLHYLDHLAPFCAQLQVPLLICEEDLFTLAEQFYPDLDARLVSFFDVQLPQILITCETRPLIAAQFPNQTFEHLWLPHGNSDKGIRSAFFEALQEEKGVFVYGQKMIDFMHAKKVFPHPIRIGNFRKTYFQKHQAFYEPLLSLPKGLNILYAPTWDDVENNNSLWNAFPQLIDLIPQEAQLLVKLHPNTLNKFAPEIEVLKGRLSKKKIDFLPNIPPIYPLLNQCCAYIGDMSSIGYDFLSFDRPMYFFNADPSFPLHRCGEPLLRPLSLAQKDYSSLRKALYHYTFDETPSWEKIKEQIDALCRP